MAMGWGNFASKSKPVNGPIRTLFAFNEAFAKLLRLLDTHESDCRPNCFTLGL